MDIIEYQSVDGLRFQLVDGHCVLWTFRTREEAEARMVEIEGSKYDRDKGAVSLDALARLDEPEQLMRELEKIAEDLSKANPRADGWRFVAKWAAECNEEFAKTQEPPSR